MVPEDQPSRAYKVIFNWIDQSGIWAPKDPSKQAEEEAPKFI